MSTSKIIYEKDLRTVMIHEKSGQEVITDAPIDNKGKGEAFSPTDLVATSLASCMLTVIGIAAQTHNFNIDGAKATIDKVMTSNPRRISKIDIEIYFPKNNYTEKEKKIIENTAKTCPVSQSLHPEIKQNITFFY